MVISISTLFPQLYRSFLETSLLARAQEKKIVSVELQNLFDFASAASRIDSPTFGPSSGMLIKPDVVSQAIERIDSRFGKSFKVFFSPHGTKINQSVLKDLALELRDKKHLLLLPARYEGMDARVEEIYADAIFSLGDMVLMGGDLPAMVLMEGLLRLIPGVVGKEESVQKDSFMGPFVDYPEYTKPISWRGISVPEIIRSGDHAKIESWRREKSAQRSVLHHFGWVKSQVEKPEDKALASKYIPPHYVILMHDQVILEQDKIGTSSVTSIDIHDIARSAATYGLKGYFIVTPLKDQQKIVKTLLDFWSSDKGCAYNSNRKIALERVKLVSSIEEAISSIYNSEDKEPRLIATAAKTYEHIKEITYNDQELVWSEEKPVVFILGTARGLSLDVINRCDYLLKPVTGFSNFNHLSVRSAAAIIFDRWLGINPASKKWIKRFVNKPN